MQLQRRAPSRLVASQLASQLSTNTSTSNSTRLISDDILASLSTSSPTGSSKLPQLQPIATNIQSISPPTITNQTVPTTTSAVLTAAPLATMLGLTLSKTPPPPPPTAPANPLLMQRPGDCELLGSFALFVQLALGALAMMSLVWKRYRERPQRPVKIWFFDVSKQVFGSAMVHAANVFMAMLTSGRFSVKLTPRSVASVAGLVGRAAETIAEGKGKDVYQPNPCSWYLLNLAVDTTLGIPVLILLIRFYTYLVSLTPLGRPAQSIESGNYGSPPKATWWLKQSIIYFCGLFGMKVVVLIFFILCPWISHIGDWALRWTEGDEELQIVFVMMLFPLIMNAMQYYVIDSFIKKQTGHSSSDSDDRGHHTRLPDSEDGVSSDDSDSDIESITDQDEAKALSSPSSDRRSFKSSTSDTPKTAEYDPAVDGDAPTLFGSSSSQTQIEGVLPSR